MAETYIAVDLGMGAEPTSLIVVEAKRWQYRSRKVWGRRGWRENGFYQDPVTGREAPDCPPPVFELRHIVRTPAGTSYAQVVANVKALLERLRGATLVLDATGVGGGAIDLFDRAQLSPHVVTLTAGDAVEENAGRYRIPKKDVITAAQVALQEQRLRIAKELSHGPLLMRELQSFRMKTDLRSTGDVLAWREGQNDDLVLSLAIAVWMAERNVGAAWEALVLDEEQMRRDHPFYDPDLDFTGMFSGQEPFDPDEL